MNLTETTDVIRFRLTAAHTTNALQYSTSTKILTVATGAIGGLIRTLGASNGTTNITAVASPGSGQHIQLSTFNVVNTDTVSHVVTIEFYNGTTATTLHKATLAPDQSVKYAAGRWQLYSSSGARPQSISAEFYNPNHIGVLYPGDADYAMDEDDPRTVSYSTTLTGDRMLGLPLGFKGDGIEVIRPAAGSSVLAVGNISTLAQHDWIRLRHDGNKWLAVAYSDTPVSPFNSVVTSPDLTVWINGDGNLDDTGDLASSVGSVVGTWQGTPAYGTRPPQGGLQSKSQVLDGSTNYWTVPSAAGDYTDDFSIAVWVKLDVIAADYVLVSKRSGGTGYEMTLNSSSLVFSSGASSAPALTLDSDDLTIGGEDVTIGDGASQTFSTAPGLITEGQWHHIGFVANGSSSQLYIDGVGLNVFDPIINSNSAALHVGRSATFDDFHIDGEVADFMIFDRAITAYEMGVLANGPA